jgi:uncharacterized protein (DUF1330 family)
MPAYLLAHIEITDAEKIKAYQAATPAAVQKYGGKFLVRGGEKLAVEGKAEKRRVVMLEFADMQKAKAFWDSPEYQACIKLREGAAIFDALILDGVK